jgi:hypothetical protein
VNDTSYVRLIFEYVCARWQRISRDAEYHSDIASGSDSLGFDNRIRFILRFVLRPDRVAHSPFLDQFDFYA